MGAALAAVSYRMPQPRSAMEPDSAGMKLSDHAFCNRILPTFRPTGDRFAKLAQFAKPACYDYGTRRIFCPSREAPCMAELLLRLP
jgi:hypothetical protein